MEAIDEEIGLLGKTCQQAIYFHLEKDFKLTRQEIPYRIKHFTQSMEAIFGDGALILEIRIMKNLFKKLGYFDPHFQDRKKLEFIEYLDAIRINTKSKSIATNLLIS